MQLRKVGYKFSQIGGAFLVHYPHSSSKARREWNKLADEARAADGGKRLPSETLKEAAHTLDLEKFHRAHIDKLFLVFKKWLNENVDDESRTPMCANVDNDDYSLWVYQTNA
jgi:hypothetical protein